MLPFEDRFTRQRRLSEVGAAGQDALARACVVLKAHASVDVEREYLVRAGVGRVEVDEGSPSDTFPFADHFQFESSRSLARAAFGALGAVRNVLGITGS